MYFNPFFLFLILIPSPRVILSYGKKWEKRKLLEAERRSRRERDERREENRMWRKERDKM